MGIIVVCGLVYAFGAGDKLSDEEGLLDVEADCSIDCSET